LNALANANKRIDLSVLNTFAIIFGKNIHLLTL